MGVWKTIPPTRPNNFSAFICRIVRNLSLKRYEYLNRAKRSADMEVSLDELTDILADDRFTPGTDDERKGTRYLYVIMGTGL